MIAPAIVVHAAFLCVAAMLERCVLWLGNDGGAKHIATAAGVPTLAVMRWQIGPVWTDETAAVAQSFIDRAPPGTRPAPCSSEPRPQVSVSNGGS